VCRENQSLWKGIALCFNGFDKWYYLKRLFRLVFYGNGYFWHDTLGRYINRWFICPLIGHRNIRYLDNGGCRGEQPYYHCFDCEQRINLKKI